MRPFRVTIVPQDFPLAARLEQALRAAAKTLGLERRLVRVSVRLRPRLDGDLAHVRWHAEGAKLAVRIDADLGNFLSVRSRRLARGRPRFAGSARRSFPARRWSEHEARATFLHELAHVADELFFGIDASAVAPRRRDPFHEAWNVWIDGRLARRGRPALSRAARLREFRRSLGRRAGRPAVRPAFERLWSARRLEQRDLLDVVERLVR
jgi:hypothetical protein